MYKRSLLYVCIMPCNSILALINSRLIAGYSCIVGPGDYALTFPLSSQRPEVSAAASISHPQLVIHVHFHLVSSLSLQSASTAPFDA